MLNISWKIKLRPPILTTIDLHRGFTPAFSAWSDYLQLATAPAYKTARAEAAYQPQDLGYLRLASQIRNFFRCELLNAMTCIRSRATHPA
jgi:hypothetical protein